MKLYDPYYYVNFVVIVTKKYFMNQQWKHHLFEKLRFFCVMKNGKIKIFCVMKNLCNPIKYVDINMNKEEQNTI